MLSKVSVTYQMDDPDLAAKELVDGLGEDFVLKNNSVGLLFCYSDMELDGLSAYVSDRLGFEIMGCTCIASLDGRKGFHEMAATLMVLTADDCSFSVEISEKIELQNVEAAVENTYKKALEKLDSVPKLVMALPPYKLDVTLDEFTNLFNKVANGVQVVGGVPSNHGDGDLNATIMNAGAYADKLVVLLISGNIRPIAIAKTVACNTVVRKRKVSCAKANTVYRVGNQTFTEYLQEVGLTMESMLKGNPTTTFVSNPLLLENVELNGEKYAFARTLHKIDPEMGSGTAVGYIPEGATLSICAMQRDHIEQATAQGMLELKEKMQEGSKQGYTYSTILAVSCVGRYLVMLPQSDAEANQILEGMPEGIELCGFYSYGEIGPVPLKGDEIHTFAHNESLVLCAF